MFSNLHTHTTRCRHAFGTEREYIEAAIAQGIRVLGFSDHAPMLFPEGYYSKRVRMLPEEMDDYVSTLQALREEYRNEIRILIGLELEYYPELFDRTLKFLSGYPLDYLILGQHYLDNEYEAPNHTMLGFSERKYLQRYVDQCIAGMEAGCFTFLAHPDCFLFKGADRDYEEEMERLCRRAVELDVPLEINMYGVIKGGHYPNDRFWEIASRVGNTVLIGLDAHRTEMLSNLEARAAAYAMAERHGLVPIDLPEIRAPFKALSV